MTHAMRYDPHWLNMTERILFRIAVTVYRCIHGIAPVYICTCYCVLIRRHTAHHLDTVSRPSSSIVVVVVVVVVVEFIQLCGRKTK